MLIPWIWNHPSNRGRRIPALGRAASFQIRGRLLNKPTLARVGKTARVLAEVGSASAARAVYANPADVPEMLVWQRVLSPGQIFVDVGANIGLYSVFAADLGAHVIAIEPGPKTAARLRRNVRLNDLSIEVVEAAVTDHTGFTEFDTSGDTTARLGKGIKVAATTLDTILDGRQCAGVKIDVEGFERLVIEGGTSALAEHRIGCLQIEWNRLSERHLGESREPIARLMARFEYALYRPNSAGTLIPTGADFGADIFALPRD